MKRPKLGAWVRVIDAILEDDKIRPAKQRHTAKRVWERLREEHQFTGGYTIMKDYLRSAAQRGRDMFVPLVHPAGEAQADFGKAVAVIGGWSARRYQQIKRLSRQRDGFAGPRQLAPCAIHGKLATATC